MTATQKSVFDYAVPEELVEIAKIEIPIAPKVPAFTKHSYPIHAESEEELMTKIADILDKAKIPYKIDKIFTKIHILYRCGSGECMLRIYKNEGEYARNPETGNFIVERDCFSRDMFKIHIYLFLEDILLNRKKVETLVEYIREIETMGFTILEDGEEVSKYFEAGCCEGEGDDAPNDIYS